MPSFIPRSAVKRLRRQTAVHLCTALAFGATLIPLSSLQAEASDTPPKGAAQWQQPKTQDVDKPSAIDAEDRARILGKNYASSKDTAFTTSGDGTGFHLLTANARDGYAWKTVATLSEDGFDTDAWIGNACVTGSGKYAAVAYAPRTFTNKPELMVRGAFTAVVNLATGKVTKLPYQATLAYFSPGCGTGDSAVFSQLSHDGDKKQQTRLITVNAATGKTAQPVTYPGQVTSAIPTRHGIIAAHGKELVKAAGGKLTTLAVGNNSPFQIKTDSDSGVTYIDRTADTVKKNSISSAQHLTSAQITKGRSTPVTLASGKLSAWDLDASASGTVVITGKATTKTALPKTVKNPGKIAMGARISTHAQAAVTTAWADGKDSRIRPEEALSERTARTTLHVLASGRTVTLDAHPDASRQDANGTGPSPTLPGRKKATGPSTQTARTQALAAGSPTNPVEDDRTCSVPRNDFKKQAFQPTPRQVEWAVDQAVVGKLNITRSANWKNTGMGSYSPQGLFPGFVLSGDPNHKLDPEDADGNDHWHIPAQILLGITAQESNMWQATRYAVPGVTANSLIGNYYGIEYSADGDQLDPWKIDWSKADCGYGITQATDGMRLPDKGQTTKTPLEQEAIALDYAANIAAGAQILSEKWNDTYDAGLTLNGGKPQWIENWFFALWAYNSGFHPKGKETHWGLGWTNNPANPLWKSNRLPFLTAADGVGDDYSHAAHPQDWPYEEKVIGWAGRPISALFAPGDFQAGYRPAWWNNNIARNTAKPPVDLFCNESNFCNPGKISENDSNDQGQGACTLDTGSDETNPHRLHCWWNKTAPAWKNCDTAADCGNGVHRFNTTYPEQPDGNAYPPRCSHGLPNGSLVIDDLQAGSIPAGDGSRFCGSISSHGTFKFSFPEWNGAFPSKIDTHQIGAGYQNHFYFAHTRKPESYPGNAGRMKVTGTWTLNQNIGGWARAYVHIPDHGAHTRQASYEVGGTDSSSSTTRVVQQRIGKNTWVPLGVFNFTGKPSISLTNFTKDGAGNEDVAWDAVAFQPLPKKPANFVVAMGDSFSSGEGASEGNANYYPETNYRDAQNKSARDACHRSDKAWSRQAKLPGAGKSIGEMADGRDASLDYHMVACSGARTYNITKKNEYGELPQLESGYLDKNTTLVTMSIGGNDSRFTPIIQACILAGDKNCADSPFRDHDADIDSTPGENRDGKYQNQPMKAAVPGLISDIVRTDITSTLQKIHEKAPNAKITLMGYPELISGDASCIKLDEFLPYGISPQSNVWLKSVAKTLATQMEGAAADAKAKGIDVKYANPISEFAGKGICGDPESIHGIVLKTVDSDEPKIDFPLLGEYGLSAQSFHPKIGGARLYANVLERSLNGWY
ncbi:GDSL-type esterase/lipase family protein [Streptomyces chattanoogensis]|uniref:GDSL-type esterase/lipase family protein n=1 Tax=Streptomyces chattanoogensis TaxID=66876 RepID=UPI0007C82E3B